MYTIQSHLRMPTKLKHNSLFKKYLDRLFRQRCDCVVLTFLCRNSQHPNYTVSTSRVCWILNKFIKKKYINIHNKAIYKFRKRKEICFLITRSFWM